MTILRSGEYLKCSPGKTLRLSPDAVRRAEYCAMVRLAVSASVIGPVKAARRALSSGVIWLSAPSASVLVFSHPISVFYLASFRAWELLVGSLLAIWKNPIGYSNRFCNLLSSLGLGMIAVSVISYSKETVFPGFSATLPVLGAALFLWGGADKSPPVNRFISSGPIVFIGKISYSLYLWHFVLLKFGSYLTVGQLGTLQTWIIIALSFCLAVLSWLFVEQPVRRTSLPMFTGRSLFGVAGLAIASLSLAGLAIRSTNGFENRLTAEQRRLIKAAGSELGSGECVPTTLQAARSHAFCKLGRGNDTPTFIAWGDSHGLALGPAIDAIARERGDVGLLVAAGGCLPLIDIVRKNRALHDCDDISENIFRFIVTQQSIRHVILIARWAYYMEGQTYKDEPTNQFNTKHVLLANRSLPAGKASTQEVVQKAFERTIDGLLAAGKQVWIIGSVPEIGKNVPKALYLKSLGIGKDDQIAPTREEFDLRQRNVTHMIEAMKRRYAINVVWPDRVLCDRNACKVVVNSSPLYQDDNHLSYFGTKLIEPVLSEIQLK